MKTKKSSIFIIILMIFVFFNNFSIEEINSEFKPVPKEFFNNVPDQSNLYWSEFFMTPVCGKDLASVLNSWGQQQSKNFFEKNKNSRLLRWTDEVNNYFNSSEISKTNDNIGTQSSSDKMGSVENNKQRSPASVRLLSKDQFKFEFTSSVKAAYSYNPSGSAFTITNELGTDGHVVFSQHLNNGISSINFEFNF